MSAHSSRTPRRRSLGRLAALLGGALLPQRGVMAQWNMNAPPGVDARMLNTAQGVIETILKGAKMQRGRVKLVLPALAENGHSVALTVRVDSPMSERDHVRTIDLVSEKNPVPHMAAFSLGPQAARAEIGTRVRLNGTQRMTAIAQMSDGSFWYDSVEIEVTEAACTDGG